MGNKFDYLLSIKRPYLWRVIISGFPYSYFAVTSSFPSIKLKTKEYYYAGVPFYIPVGYDLGGKYIVSFIFDDLNIVFFELKRKILEYSDIDAGFSNSRLGEYDEIELYLYSNWFHFIDNTKNLPEGYKLGFRFKDVIITGIDSEALSYDGGNRHMLLNTEWQYSRVVIG